MGPVCTFRILQTWKTMSKRKPCKGEWSPQHAAAATTDHTVCEKQDLQMIDVRLESNGKQQLASSYFARTFTDITIAMG